MYFVLCYTTLMLQRLGDPMPRCALRGVSNPFGLTDAPLASAVELRALQVVVVTVVMRVVLMVVVVLVVVLGLLDDIVSRTSSKQKAAILLMSHRKRMHTAKTRGWRLRPTKSL